MLYPLTLQKIIAFFSGLFSSLVTNKPMKIHYYTGLALMASGMYTVSDREWKGMILAQPNFLLGHYLWNYSSALSLLSSDFIGGGCLCELIYFYPIT